MVKLINLQVRGKLHRTKRTFSYYGANNALLEAAAGLGQSNHRAAAWAGGSLGAPRGCRQGPLQPCGTQTVGLTLHCTHFLPQTSFISLPFLNPY